MQNFTFFLKDVFHIKRYCIHCVQSLKNTQTMHKVALPAKPNDISQNRKNHPKQEVRSSTLDYVLHTYVCTSITCSQLNMYTYLHTCILYSNSVLQGAKPYCCNAETAHFLCKVLVNDCERHLVDLLILVLLQSLNLIKACICSYSRYIHTYIRTEGEHQHIC